MLRIKVKKGQVDRALKLFKRKFKNSGTLKELREKQQFTKKSLKKKLLKNKAIHYQKYLNNKEDE